MNNKLFHDLLMCVLSSVMTSESVWDGGTVLIPPPQSKLQSRNKKNCKKVGRWKRAPVELNSDLHGGKDCWAAVDLNQREGPMVTELQAGPSCCDQRELPLLE